MARILWLLLVISRLKVLSPPLSKMKANLILTIPSLATSLRSFGNQLRSSDALFLPAVISFLIKVLQSYMFAYIVLPETSLERSHKMSNNQSYLAGYLTFLANFISILEHDIA